ncbi:Hypothetical protein A7982_01376 [Minicystis rosea]|nr:Hypothetical protein A7982_01376 [Minicystis rosea]
MDDDTGLTVWNAVLKAALRLPGVRVDRTSFLRSALTAQVPADAIERAVATTPAKAGISKDVIRRAAQSSIAWHRAGVSATSAVASLPGGWWIMGTIPVEMTQYFWHVVVVLQKLAYLHGWPSLFQEEDDIDDETKLVLTLFIGVTLGAKEAATGLSKLATAMGTEVVKRLPRAPLTKYAIYQIAKQVAKWVGVKLTKRKFAELVGRAVPIVGGGVAGIITWFAFGGGADRLLDHLERFPQAGSHER